MKVIDPGHVYELECLNGIANGQRPYGYAATARLAFVKRIGDRYPGNSGDPQCGPTTQEVLRALIDRTKYVDAQIPSDHNREALCCLRGALREFEKRAAKERGESERLVETLRSADLHARPIESIPTCAVCGHVACGRHGESAP